MQVPSPEPRSAQVPGVGGMAERIRVMASRMSTAERKRCQTLSADDSTLRIEVTREAEGRTVTFAVDRREGGIVVLVADEGGEAVEVGVRELPPECRKEGAVLRVPVAVDGSPEWARAVRDREEERRRLAELSERVERLRRGDPGGDVTL